MIVKKCAICHKVKVNNAKKEGEFMTITSNRRLEKVFLDICGPFPRSGGRHRYKYIVIIWDHFSKYTKLYPISKASTKVILKIVLEKYTSDVGTPESVITDHGTQFKGKRWREALLARRIKTYKTSIYHPSSNPAERVLREVGQILRTYCHSDHKSWSEHVTNTEIFLNIAYHETLGLSPYQMMFLRPPPRELTQLITFPEMPEEELDITRAYHRIGNKITLRRNKRRNSGIPELRFKVGERVPVSYTHLDVYKRQTRESEEPYL